MDPLSIIASVAGVASLTVQICSSLCRLRSLCKSLPGRLHAVHNEVSDLEVVIQQVDLLVKERQDLISQKQLAAAQYLLNQATAKLTELKTIVDLVLDACSNAGFRISGAYMWRKNQTALKELQDDIRTIKCNLNIFLGASNSFDLTQTALKVQAISVVTLQASKAQLDMQEKFLGSMAAVDERITRMEEILQQQTLELQANQIQQFGPSYNIQGKFEQPKKTKSDTVIVAPPQPEGLAIRVTPYIGRCRPGCPCACHSQQKSSTPAVLSNVLGRLFIGYAGVPILGPKCTVEGCQKSQSSHINVEYWFPFTFISSTILRMNLSYQAHLGSLFYLDTLRRVPDSAQCVSFAVKGDIEGLKKLFRNGLASPRDVSTSRGYSLLRWALYAKQYKACEFLVAAGADPDYRPLATSDNNPRIKACHFLLEGGLPEQGVLALKTITKGNYFDDFISESNFTQLHKVVLGLSLLDLQDSLLFHPSDINTPDAMGRTPLAWAAARGDTKTVVTLLSNGADPNITDIQLSGPLSNSASRGYTSCVRLLLEVGADPDPPLPSGVRKGSPLCVATRNATDPMLLKCLLDFGADVDSRGSDGQTPLIHAAQTDNSNFAILLLDYGANINASTDSKMTALTVAISHNSHNVLRLILDRWQEYSSCPRLAGPNLLQLTALYADVETMNILTATEHFRTKHDKKYTLGGFQQTLLARSDLTEKLTMAFDALLDTINHVPDMQKGLESVLESGYYSPDIAIGNAAHFERLDRCHFQCPNPSRNIASDDSSSEDCSSEDFEDALENIVS